jgi:hypothetical protein
MGAVKKIGTRLGLASRDSDVENYEQQLKAERERNREAAKQNPISFYGGQTVGSLGTAVAGGGIPALVAQGALTGYGMSEDDAPARQVGEALIGGALGGAVGAFVPAVAQQVGGALRKGGQALQSGAENLAQKAIGLTGRELQKAGDDVGRFALDQGLVKFGSSPANIATAAKSLKSEAGRDIGSVLAQSNQKISNQQLADALYAESQSLAQNEAQAGVANKLKALADDLMQSPTLERSLKDIEQVKRGYQSRTNYGGDRFSDDAQARKIAANIYKTSVEDAVVAGNPELAAQFQQAKQTFGSATPIAKGAERRAATIAQNPIFGLNDIASAGAGGLIGGIPGAITSAIARRTVGPRLSSSAAVTADVAGKALTKVGQSLERAGIRNPDAVANSPYGQILLNSMAKNPDSAAVTNFLLAQKDPEYRKIVSGKKNR